MTRREQMAARRIAANRAAGIPGSFRRVRSLGLAATMPEHLRDNPNDGKRHAARMMPTDLDTARQIDRFRQPVPITVREHRIGKRGAMSKRVTHTYVTHPSDFR